MCNFLLYHEVLIQKSYGLRNQVSLQTGGIAADNFVLPDKQSDEQAGLGVFFQYHMGSVQESRPSVSMIRHDVLGGFSHLLQNFSVMGYAIFDVSRQDAFCCHLFRNCCFSNAVFFLLKNSCLLSRLVFLDDSDRVSDMVILWNLKFFCPTLASPMLRMIVTNHLHSFVQVEQQIIVCGSLSKTADFLAT